MALRTFKQIGIPLSFDWDDAVYVPPKPVHIPPVVAEIRRRDSNYQRILDRLRRGPATNLELNAICFRYGGRIHEMRQNGLNITTERRGRGVFVFTLKDDNESLSRHQRPTGTTAHLPEAHRPAEEVRDGDEER